MYVFMINILLWKFKTEYSLCVLFYAQFKCKVHNMAVDNIISERNKSGHGVHKYC